MRFLSGLLLSFAFLFAAPAAAQSQDRLGEVGRWVSRFAEATSEPNVAAAACAPQFQAAVFSGTHDAASARTALTRIKPCAGRIRTSYARTIAKLDALGPLPAGVGEASFSSEKFIAEQRRLAVESVAQVDKVERLLNAIIANNHSALPRLANDVRLGGAALIDSNILMLRLQKEIAQFQSSRQLADVRILLAEAGKALIVSAQSPRGIAAGPRFAELTGRARQLRPNLLNAWSVDKARMDALRGSGGESDADRVIAILEPMIAEVAADSERLAQILANAGARPVLSLSEATRLAVDLQSIDLQLQTRAKALGSALASGR